MIRREKVGVPGCVILLQFRRRRLGRETTFWTPGQSCAARRKGIGERGWKKANGGAKREEGKGRGNAGEGRRQGVGDGRTKRSVSSDDRPVGGWVNPRP